MSDVIAIRLHPVEPIDASEFTNYLNDLTITAYDVSFAHPQFTPEPTQQIDVASRLPGDDNRVVQHTKLVPNPIPPPPNLPPLPQSLATAVIEVQGGGAEYETKDVLLSIERGGNKIIERSVHYNVAIDTLADLEDHEDYQGLETSIYLALPSPGHERDPNVAFVDLPDDGSPPNFGELKAAVVKVLEDDPGPAPPDDTFLATITPQQSRHIGYEIIWNRQTRPLPVPSRSLNDMYTPPESDDEKVEQARKQFEAELLSQYNTLNAEADRLGRYIYSLSAAIACEHKSDQAERVGFRFPVRPGNAEDNTKIKESEVIISNP